MTTRRSACLGALLLLGCVSPPEQAALGSPRGSPREVASLGATTRAPSSQETDQLGLEVEVRVRGQVVSAVAPAGTAARAGIEAGDVIVRLDGNDIHSHDDIADFLRVSRPGQRVQAVVVRAKTSAADTVAVALGAAPQGVAGTPCLTWEFASLGQLDAALAKARGEDRLVLVGLSGAET